MRVRRGSRGSQLLGDGREWHLQVARLGRLAAVGRLLGALAHDLVQPLTSILSNAQAGQRLLSDGRASVEEMRGILTDIISADAHANDLIQKIRALLKPHATKLECVELSDAIHDATSFVSGELAVHQVEVATDIGPDVPAVNADRVQLGQVLLNLLLNAVQAMGRTPRRRRRVLIRVRRAGATVEVAVEDAGKGLEATQLKHMFDPFYTTKKNGLGLGLWLCKTIVAAHRGRMWVTRNERAGITAHFTLRPYRTAATRQFRHRAGAAATIRSSREAARE
jgi:C4-dicarboxylate-specific signal transduction histidine kinase